MKYMHEGTGRVKALLLALFMPLSLLAHATSAADSIGYSGQQVLVIDDIEMQNGTCHNLDIQLFNSSAVCAMQFYIDLPEGMTLGDDVELGEERCTDHTVRVKTGDHAGRYLVMVASPTNATFNGGAGMVLTFSLRADSMQIGEYAVALTSIILANPDGDNIATNDEAKGTVHITLLASLNERRQDVASEACHTLDGRLVTRPTRPGLYIKNRKKIIIK